jgi:glycine betaine/proline transport system permease protein/glycine betaine/proline transport system substrate-binding protein
MKRMTRLLVAALMLAALMAVPAQAEAKTNIVFAEVGWDSIRFHNAVAAPWPKRSSIHLGGGLRLHAHHHLRSADEGRHRRAHGVWTDNLATYDDDIAQAGCRSFP